MADLGAHRDLLGFVLGITEQAVDAEPAAVLDRLQQQRPSFLNLLKSQVFGAASPVRMHGARAAADDGHAPASPAAFDRCRLRGAAGPQRGPGGRWTACTRSRPRAACAWTRPTRTRCCCSATSCSWTSCWRCAAWRPRTQRRAPPPCVFRKRPARAPLTPASPGAQRGEATAEAAAGLFLEERRALVAALHRLLQAQALPAADAEPALAAALAAFNADLLGARAGGRSVLLSRLIELIKARARAAADAARGAGAALTPARAGGRPGRGAGLAAGGRCRRARAPGGPPQPGGARAHAAVRGARPALRARAYHFSTAHGALSAGGGGA